MEVGLLVSPDDAKRIADALARILKNAECAEKQAKRARAQLDAKHAIGPWLDGYENVYRIIFAANVIS
jgi:hypothetical protein